MIRSLRKRHLNIWLIIAVFLPLGFIAAVLATPQSLDNGALDVPEKGKLLKQMTMDWGPVELRGLPERASNHSQSAVVGLISCWDMHACTTAFLDCS